MGQQILDIEQFGIANKTLILKNLAYVHCAFSNGDIYLDVHTGRFRHRLFLKHTVAVIVGNYCPLVDNHNRRYRDCHF